MNKTGKISNLLSCYQDLASGVPPQVLHHKYVKIEVVVAFELFDRGITLQQLQDFVLKRDAHIQAMLNGHRWSLDAMGKVVVT